MSVHFSACVLILSALVLCGCGTPSIAQPAAPRATYLDAVAALNHETKQLEELKSCRHDIQQLYLEKCDYWRGMQGLAGSLDKTNPPKDDDMPMKDKVNLLLKSLELEYNKDVAEIDTKIAKQRDVVDDAQRLHDSLQP